MGNKENIVKCEYCLGISGISCKPTPKGNKRDMHDGRQTLADQRPDITKCLKKRFGVDAGKVIGADGIIPPKGKISVNNSH